MINVPKEKNIFLLRFILYETVNIENQSSEKTASNGDEQNARVFIYVLD